MRQSLQLHPESRCDALTGIEANVRRTPGARLEVQFTVRGYIDQLAVPRLRAAARADGLWKSTCFEVFLRATPDAAYYEFNFSPSTEWAAYSFAGYRAGLRDVAGAAPSIGVTPDESGLALQAEVELANVPGGLRDSVWRLGLSAIIEETNGRKSYWALRHPPGKPDFHHPDCFALELPPP